MLQYKITVFFRYMQIIFSNLLIYFQFNGIVSGIDLGIDLGIDFYLHSATAVNDDVIVRFLFVVFNTGLIEVSFYSVQL